MRTNLHSGNVSATPRYPGNSNYSLMLDGPDTATYRSLLDKYKGEPSHRNPDTLQVIQNPQDGFCFLTADGQFQPPATDELVLSGQLIESAENMPKLAKTKYRAAVALLAFNRLQEKLGGDYIKALTALVQLINPQPATARV